MPCSGCATLHGENPPLPHQKSHELHVYNAFDRYLCCSICVAADHRASDFLFSSYISYLYNFPILFPTHVYKKCLFQKNPYYIIKQRLIVLFVKLLSLFVCKVQKLIFSEVSSMFEYFLRIFSHIPDNLRGIELIRNYPFSIIKVSCSHSFFEIYCVFAEKEF